MHFNYSTLERKEIPYGYIIDDKVYLAKTDAYPERIIGEVKNSDEEAVKYFQDRFAQLVVKVSELENNIMEAENKGSFLMKLVHLKDAIASHDGLGDYRPLSEKLNQLEIFLNEVIAKNRVRNTDVKRSLLQEAGEIKNIADWKEATEMILDIKGRWLRTGNAQEELNDAFELQFKQILDDFFDRRKSFFEEKQKLSQVRLDQYQRLIQQLKKTESITFGESRMLQQQWKAIGKVPPTSFKALSSEFNRLIKQKIRSSKAGFTPISAEEQEKNYHAKNHLIEKLQALKIEGEADVTKTIKAIRAEWKNIGNVPREKYHHQLETFQSTADMLTEHYFLETMASAKDDNYMAKNNREKIRIKLRLLKELLVRDEKELQAFYDNMQNVNTRQSPMSKLIEDKLQHQKHKVNVKKTLMRFFKHSLDTI